MPRPPLHSALAAVALLAAGCVVSSPAPPAWQRTAVEAAQAVYGSWVVVERNDGLPISGELIAVENDAVYVATAEHAYRVSLEAIVRVEVAAFEGEVDRQVALGVVGTLSTVTHGFFLVFSAPTWYISTTISSRLESGEGHYEMTSLTDLDWLSRYARFPQGLPPGYGRIPGTAGGRCYGNQTCDRGLRCDDGLCAEDPEQGEIGRRCHPDGSCASGLACAPDRRVCEAPPPTGGPGGACYAGGACDPGLDCDRWRCVEGGAP